MGDLRLQPAKKTYRTICSPDARCRVRRYANSSRAQSSLLPLGLEVEHSTDLVLRRSIRLFPNVDVFLAQAVWTQTPPGRSSTVGWTVLLDRSTAAIGATNMRTNQPRRIEAKSSCSTVVLTLAYGPSRTGLMTFSCKPALFRDTS